MTVARTLGPQNKSLSREPLDHQGSYNGIWTNDYFQVFEVPITLGITVHGK